MSGENTLASPKRHVGLVVIHGVGMTEPGYALNTLLGNLADKVPGYRLRRTTSLEWLAEAPADASSPKFPVASRDASYRNELDIAGVELHWADLTNLQPGRLNATLGSFRIIFESHHLVDAMLRRGRDALASVLRAILWFASWMMRGPIAAFTIAASAYCMFLLFGPVIAPPGDASTSPLDIVLGDVRQRFVIVQFALLVTAIVAVSWIVRHKDITWYDTAFWLVAVTGLLLLLDSAGWLADALKFVPSLDRRPVAIELCLHEGTFGACYIDGLYRIIIFGWRIYGFILLLALAALGGRVLLQNRPTPDASLAPIAASIATVILQFMMWTTIVVTLLYAMLNRAEVNRDLLDARPDILALLAQKAVDPDSAAFKFFQFPDVKFDWIDRFKFVYAMTALTVLISLGVVMWLLFVRRRLAAAAGADRKAAAEKMPRVLFSPIIIGTLVVLFLMLIALVYFQRMIDDYEWFRDVRKWFLPFAAAVALLVPFAFGHRIANFVHIARDLIDHQYALRIETMPWFFPLMFRNQPDRPRRAQIQARLASVISQLVKEKELSDVIFVAHSQGSVVAFDYIRDHIDSHAEVRDAKVQLMSFGSPLGHIYQKYFDEYAPAGAHWLSVCQRVDHWINLYRIDDPIGGEVVLPKGGDIDNIAMRKLGGHMNYWDDEELAAALHSLILDSAASSGAYVRPPDPPRCMPALWTPPPRAMYAP